MQRLARAEPVGPAVAGGEQYRGGGGRRAVGIELPEGPVQVEVALRQPPRLGRCPGGERVRRDAVARQAALVPAPAAYIGPGGRIEIQLAAGRGGDIRQPLVGQGPVDERQRGSLGQRVVLEPGQQAGRQRVGENGPRCVCRCGTAASSWRSQAVTGSSAPSLTRASRRSRAGSGSSSTTGR